MSNFLAAHSRFLRRTTAARNGLLTGLVAFWPFNEAAGANDALDLHSGAKTLTQVNTPGANTGKVYSTAREFVPASTQYFTRSDSTLYGSSSADFTVAAWFNAYTLQTTPNYHKIADTLTYGGGWALGVWGGVTEMQAFFQVGTGDGAYFAASHAVLLGNRMNEWHLFIGWQDFANKTIYSQIDATAGQVQTDAKAPKAGSSYVRFGTKRAANGEWWDGLIGPMMYWSRILTEAERTALYNGGLGLPYASFTV